MSSLKRFSSGHEADVEMRVVRDERPVPGELQEHLHRLFLKRRVGDVAVADAGKLGDVGRDVPLGVDEGVKLLLYLAAGEYDRAYLGHAVVHGVESRRLDIEGDKLRVKRELALADDGVVAVHIVDEVGFHAVDYLDAVLFPGLPHIRERLRDAVVGHGDGGHTPVRGALHDLRGIGQRVERGEAGVQMQLHALFLGVVGAYVALALDDVARVENHVVVVFAVYYLALHDEMVAHLDLVDDGLVVVGAEKAGYLDGAAAVSDIKAQHRAAAFLEHAARHGDDVALDRHLARFETQRIHRHGVLLYRAAVDHVALRRVAGVGGFAGRRGGGGELRAREVRRHADAAQPVVGLQPLAQGLKLGWRRHRREPRRDCHRHLRRVHLHIRHIRLVKPAAERRQIGTARKYFEKRCMLAHCCSLSFSISSVSASHRRSYG